MSNERYSRSETTALCELASLLGKSDFVLEYASALLLASLAGRRVAVVGIVKRGKSTLINVLIGAEVTPVGMLPETAAVLAFGTSGTERISAHGFDESLRRRALPGSARRFRGSVKREGRRKIVAGVLDCKSPLPPGLWLIDTPGSMESEVGKRSVGVSGVPKSLGQLIDAVVVVVGIPGFSSSDLKLTREIQQLHIGIPTFVVVKALDSSVSMSDLVEYSKLYLGDLSCGVTSGCSPSTQSEVALAISCEYPGGPLSVYSSAVPPCRSRDRRRDFDKRHRTYARHLDHVGD